MPRKRIPTSTERELHRAVIASIQLQVAALLPLYSQQADLLIVARCLEGVRAFFDKNAEGDGA